MTNTPRLRRPQARLVKARNPIAITVEACDSRVDLGARLIIEYAETADMDDGQPLPPLIVDGVVWCVVRRLPDAHTRWRRISLAETRAVGRRQVARELRQSAGKSKAKER